MKRVAFALGILSLLGWVGGLALADQATEGKAIFMQYCASCHGPQGRQWSARGDLDYASRQPVSALPAVWKPAATRHHGTLHRRSFRWESSWPARHASVGRAVLRRIKWRRSRTQTTYRKVGSIPAIDTDAHRTASLKLEEAASQKTE